MKLMQYKGYYVIFREVDSEAKRLKWYDYEAKKLKY